MLSVNIQIKGDKETIAKLKRLGGRLTDWTPELKTVGDFLKTFYSQAVFETEGGILGSRWAGLSTAYEFWKRKTYPGRGILVRTGKMKDSYQYTSDKTSMELGNTATYAIFHQKGTKFMPKRMLMTINNSTKDKIVDIFKVGLAQRINEASRL